MALSDLDTNAELNYNADKSCLGEGALFLTDYERPVDVQGYDPAIGTKTYRTTSGAFMYDHTSMR